MKFLQGDLKSHFMTFTDLDGVLNWQELFGNQCPVELDVGCGRGLFLVNAGLANQDINYLGLELNYKEGRRAARRLKKQKMANVRILGGDANTTFDKFIAPASVSAIHVYFPDPWWKRRHMKRRLFTDVFAAKIAMALRIGGLLHVWTDVQEYFHVIGALMDRHEKFNSLPPLPEHAPTHDMDYRTSLERKKRKAGRKIYRGRWCRRVS